MISRIEDALELSNCNKNQIELGPHAEDMVEDRNINKQSIYDCLVEKGVSGILEQRINRFKLFYKQNGSRVNYDLIIVIDFEDSKEKKYKSCNYI